MMVAGALLLLGPVWGMIGTVHGMTRAFRELAAPVPVTPEQLATNIGIAMWSTVAGWLVVPAGIGLLAGGIVWLSRIREGRRGTAPQVHDVEINKEADGP